MWHTAFFELLSGLVISRMVYFLIGVAVLYEASAPLNSYHYLFNKTGICSCFFSLYLLFFLLSGIETDIAIGMDMMKYVCIKTFTVYGIKYPVLCIFKLIEARWTGQFERPEFDYYDLYGVFISFFYIISSLLRLMLFL